jgi:hypothetical protein
MLAAAHQLLNNTTLAHASLSGAEQWRHDIDQHVITTINNPHHEGGRQEPLVAHSRSPSVTRTPPFVHMPHQLCMPLRIAMVDLRN